MRPTGIIFAALDCDADVIEAWNRWYDLEHTPPDPRSSTASCKAAATSPPPTCTPPASPRPTPRSPAAARPSSRSTPSSATPGPPSRA
ncbi:hypothetical protein ACU686_33050 [Yinghuangia aomiensis]